jgi:hypothetical protein
MESRTVQLPYDDHAELALARVGLLRSGVPVRVLDNELPISKKRRQGPGQ